MWIHKDHKRSLYIMHKITHVIKSILPSLTLNVPRSQKLKQTNINVNTSDIAYTSDTLNVLQMLIK